MSVLKQATQTIQTAQTTQATRAARLAAKRRKTLGNMLTTEDVAELLEVGQGSVCKWAREGIVESSKLKGIRSLVFRSNDIERIMTAKEIAGGNFPITSQFVRAIQASEKEKSLRRKEEQLDFFENINNSTSDNHSARVPSCPETKEIIQTDKVEATNESEIEQVVEKIIGFHQQDKATEVVETTEAAKTAEATDIAEVTKAIETPAITKAVNVLEPAANETFLSTREAAQILGIGCSTMAKKARKGEIASQKLAGNYLFKFSDIKQFDITTNSISAKEFAKMAGVDPSTVHDWARGNHIPSEFFKGRRMFRIKDAKAFINSETFSKNTKVKFNPSKSDSKALQYGVKSTIISKVVKFFQRLFF